MSPLRLTGLTISVLILAFVLLQSRQRRYRRREVLLGLLIAGSLAAVSLYPPLVNGLTTLFEAQTRIMAIVIVSNIVLFGLFLFVLREVSALRGSLGELVRALARQEFGKTELTDRGGEIVVVIPAFNEEKNLEQLLPRIPPRVQGKPTNALVIVDGARDRSAAVAQKYAVPVTSHAINRGGGAALRTGFELALQAGAIIVVTMDADGQHDPAEIEALVEPIQNDQADVVIGNRLAGHYADQGGARHLGIVLFSWLVSLLSGTRIHDCTNGFRAIRASALSSMDLREQQFHTAEFIMEAARNRLRLCEVPVSVLARNEGLSKKPAGLRYPLGFAWTLFKIWLRS